MSQLQPYEVTPVDYNGESEETDHRITWVVAASIEKVNECLSGTGAKVTDLPASFLDEAGIDYHLPKDARALRRFVLDPEASVSSSAQESESEAVAAGFNAMGKPIPSSRRDAAFKLCREMGMGKKMDILHCVNGMSDHLERDQPAEAQALVLHYMDATGACRLMAVLLAA